MTSSDQEAAHTHLGHAVALSIEVLRSLLILNGSAAVALVALTGKGPAAHDYSRAVLSFGIGAFAAVAAMVFGYFSQLSYGNHWQAKANSDRAAEKRTYQCHLFFQTLAISTVLLCLVFGAVGLFEGLQTARG